MCTCMKSSKSFLTSLKDHFRIFFPYLLSLRTTRSQTTYVKVDYLINFLKISEYFSSERNAGIPPAQ